MFIFYGAAPFLHPYLYFCHLSSTSHNYIAYGSDGIKIPLVTVAILGPPNDGNIPSSTGSAIYLSTIPIICNRTAWDTPTRNTAALEGISESAIKVRIGGKLKYGKISLVSVVPVITRGPRMCIG